MPRRSVDFLVVGGGPAGCAFAILAARAGASVVLAERGDYRKRRPGEHLAGRVRGALDELGVSTNDARVIGATSPGILSLWNGQEPVAKPYAAGGQPDALCVIRHRFDELLFCSAEQARATVLSRATLNEITHARRSGWEISIKDSDLKIHRLFARSVVDASGRNAIVARSQGARRIHHGDLLAIVAWLEANGAPLRPSAMLTVESCRSGWWSLSIGADETLVATLYTSSRMLKEAHASPEMFWTCALDETRTIGRFLRRVGAMQVESAVYPAFPSRLSKISGDGWIAVGEAAIAFDPLAGQGVALALETAFRAFEAATVDPSWSRLGADYSDALIDRFDRHLDGRVRIYEDAAGVLAEPFIRHSVETSGTRKPANSAYG